jgi:hypothetical protein
MTRPEEIRDLLDDLSTYEIVMAFAVEAGLCSVEDAMRVSRNGSLCLMVGVQDRLARLSRLLVEEEREVLRIFLGPAAIAATEPFPIEDYSI